MGSIGLSIIVDKSNADKDIYILSGKEKNHDKLDFIMFKDKKWKHFAMFAKQTTTIRVIIFKKNECNLRGNDQRRSESCSCRKYLKDYIFHNVIGLSLRLKYIDLPNRLRQISQKRREVDWPNLGKHCYLNNHQLLIK